MSIFFRAAVIGVASIALAGCGGGGGGGDDESSGFALTAAVAGTPVPGFSVANGQSGTISMDSGQELLLASSSAVTWTTNAGSPVTPTPVKAATDTVLDDTLASPQGGELVFTVASKDDPSLTATVTVKVAPQRFTAKAAVVNASTSYQESDTFVNGTKSDTTYSRLTTSVAADGSYTTDSLNAAAVVTDHYAEDANGNRLSRTYANNGNLCTYDPSREYLSFPMYFGKTWNSTWQYSCTAGYHETATQNAVVEAWEPVTVAAGTFDALRVRINTAFTNSNDVNLTNGSSGTAEYSIALLAWYAPEVGKYVKYQFDYTYKGTAPATYLTSLVQSMK